MRLKIRQLRKLVREIAMSPSLMNQEPIKGPLEDKGIAKVLQTLQTELSTSLKDNLVMTSFKDNYDAETRQFDDGAYEQASGTADRLTNEVMTQLKALLEKAWAQTHRKIAPSGMRKVA